MQADHLITDRVDTKILSDALRDLSRSMTIDDPMAISACLQAADRLDHQQQQIEILGRMINEPAAAKTMPKTD